MQIKIIRFSVSWHYFMSMESHSHIYSRRLVIHYRKKIKLLNIIDYLVVDNLSLGFRLDFNFYLRIFIKNKQ